MSDRITQALLALDSAERAIKDCRELILHYAQSTSTTTPTHAFAPPPDGCGKRDEPPSRP